MALRVRITPVEKTIKAVLDSRLSPQARSLRFAQFAQHRISEADEQNRRALGNVPPKTVTVDGRKGAPLESVNPDRGIIVAEWQLIGDVVSWISATLKQRSPVQSGRYRNYHILYADGVEVLAREDVPSAQEYIFLNPLPYSRKIEIGKTRAGRDFVIQVPNRIYERTANDAQKRFGNVARIRFTYQSILGGALARRNRAIRIPGRGTSRVQNDRVPAIVVSLR